jgi:hypothetical protein
MKQAKDIGRVFVLFLATVFSVALAGQSSAATSTFNFDVTFSGMSPGGTTPYLTAIFDDSYGDANTVRLFIDVLNLDSTSSVTHLYFNFDPSLDPGALNFAAVDNGDSVPNSVTGSTDAYKADGDGLYDISFDMPPPTGDFYSRLTNGETLIYDISYSSAINASSFSYISTPDGGAGTYFAAAHVQGIGDGSATNSGWVGVVPEPVSSTLFIVGAATLGFRRFRKKFKA